MVKRRLLTTMLFSLLSVVLVMAQHVTIDGITYKIQDDHAYVSGCDKKLEVAIIKSSISYKGKEYPVTQIGRNNVGFNWLGRAPFYPCNIKSVSIPNSVTCICIGSFYWNKKLKEIIVPDKPIDIYTDKKSNGSLNDFSAFYDCTNVETVRCQNGSFPSYMMEHLPENSPFVLTNKYKFANNNQYALQSPVQQAEAAQEQPKVPSSDVDVDIPQGNVNNDNTFAIIIANEDYQNETKVDYAKNDGKIFKDYCHKTLGLPEKNVHYIANATRNNIVGELYWLSQVCDAFKGDASVIFYYAGHGLPDEDSGSAYLLPVDGNSQLIPTCYSINELYETLGKLPAKKVAVLMDACFSGAKRNGGMLASARGVAIKAKESTPQGNMIVLSAAQGNETAYKYEEAKHGLFTYFLLKKLKETKGNVTMGELGSYLQDQVGRYSIVENGKRQTPSVQTSDKLKDNWESLRFD